MNQSSLLQTGRRPDGMHNPGDEGSALPLLRLTGTCGAQVQSPWWGTTWGPEPQERSNASLDKHKTLKTHRPVSLSVTQLWSVIQVCEHPTDLWPPWTLYLLLSGVFGWDMKFILEEQEAARHNRDQVLVFLFYGQSHWSVKSHPEIFYYLNPHKDPDT